MKSDYYLNFENKFRGNRQTIINRLSSYDSLINLYISEKEDVSLIDIGCGRGEWLEKWRESIPNSIGIEQDLNMVNLCRGCGLNVIQGEAIDTLSSLDSNSISLITIFHVIEHIENDELTLLLEHCYRVLRKDGLLIMETPSIDNLLVSSKLFYIDSTHINHINPDRITYQLEYLGFIKAKYYYLNGGPLQNEGSLKLTRLLNGVAQDLLIIACKSKLTSDILFVNNLEWEFELFQAPSTLEAAVDYDCELQKFHSDQSKLISDLNQEILLFKERLNLLENRQLTINKLLYPIIRIAKFFQKLIIYICTNIFSVMVNYRFTRLILNSKFMLFIIRLCFKILPLKSSNISLDKVYLALNKVKQIDLKSICFNQKLLNHYTNSESSVKLKNLLIKRIFRKEK